MKKLNKKIISVLLTALLAANVGALSASAAKTGVDDGTIVFPSDTTYLAGDINNDNKLDVRDLLRLKKYLADAEGKTEINVDNAKLNDDNVIDSLDLAALRQLLLQAI